MSDPISEGVKAVAGPFKVLVVDRIVEYVGLIKSYEDTMTELRNELNDLCLKKLDLDAKVMKAKDNMEVMTRQTVNWLKNVTNVIQTEEMKMLMKEDGVADIVARVMDRRALKNLWKEDRDLFDIVINVVKKKCTRQESREGDEEVVDAEEDADYKKVGKVVADVMKDLADEFTMFIQSEDAAVEVVELLDDEDLRKLTENGHEMAVVLTRVDGMIRKNIEQSDHDEHELLIPLIPKNNEVVHSFDTDRSMIRENVQKCRKYMGSLMSFLDDDNFKKGLPDGARVGFEVLEALSKSSGSDEVEPNRKPHRYCGYRLPNFKVYRHRHDMSQIAQVMVKDVKSVILKYPSDPVTRSRRNDELDIIPGEFADGLESRELLMRKILVALRDDQVNIVGVYGMGGCGKTTIAKEIAHKRSSDLFDKRVVVEVSEAPNIKGIQNQIAGGIGLTLDNMHTTAQRARILYNQLKSEKKKILIVLDNVWEKLKLDDVGIPHGNTKDFCVKLLITTREGHVCRVMDVQEANIFKVGLLNTWESLILFEKQTEKKIEKGEFKPVTDKLLRKCGGLPLAIATTSSALRGKDLRMWCDFAETLEKPMSSQVSSEYRETYSILETSYRLIDIEEKKTFLFLACLSPLDSAITVDDLMRYGIGLNLFQRVNGLSEAMELASKWTNELISSSLLLKGDSDGQVRIHDLVRASAISFNDKDKKAMTLVETIPRWMHKEMFEKFRAISLMSGHGYSRLSGVKAPLLEILLLKGDIFSTTLAPDFFKEMKYLKVLSLSDINFEKGLPESMGELERLQTLHLHHCKLRDVTLIGKLIHLLVLSLRDSSLEELAVEIGMLCNLRVLDLGGCKGMKRMSANILSNLSHLEGLYMLNGFDDWASELGEVHNIASASEIEALSHLNVLQMDVKSINQLLTLNNVQLVERLGKFDIRFQNCVDKGEELNGFRYVLALGSMIQSPKGFLRALLKKTEGLSLNSLYNLNKNVVPELDEDGFKDLKYLSIIETKASFLISSDEQNQLMAFANLELLAVQHCKQLEMICNGKVPAGTFCNLRRLYLIGLPLLKCGLPVTSGAFNLTGVFIDVCPILKSIAYKDDFVEENKKTDADIFPHLKSLHLKYVYDLSSMMSQSSNEVFSLFNGESEYPSLEDLKLKFNFSIEKLWSPACNASSFQNLKELWISTCDGLQSLGSPSIFAALVQLEKLEIVRCENLKEVISKEKEGDIILENATINFPKLKHLSLTVCDDLKRFYRGSYDLKFPSLKSLCLSNKKFTNLDGSETSTTILFSNKIEFPRLEELEVRDLSREVLSLWNWSSSVVNPVPNLKRLTLGKVDGLVSIPHSVSHKLSHLQVFDFNNIKSIFSVSTVNGEAFCTYSQLPNLMSLGASRCMSLEQLFDSEDGDGVASLCERLTEITLAFIPKLKVLPLHLLRNIRALTLEWLSWKYIFIKGKEQLQLLESLKIDDCKNMDVIIKDDELVGDGEESVYSFPRLKILKFRFLNITTFASNPNTVVQFPSLESIELYNCGKIQSFWSGSFIAPNLKEVKVKLCDNIQYFLSGKRNEVQELPSLERVELTYCPRMLSFSSEPLVVPKLHHVSLYDCTEMRWFLLGDPNNNDIGELPSLETVSINYCNRMKSFISGRIEAPKLFKLEVDKEDYSKCANEELQDIMLNLPGYIRKQRESEEKGGQNAGEMEELRNDEQNTNANEVLEEVRTEEQGNNNSQEEQNKEEDEESDELPTEANVKSQEEQSM